MNVHAHSPAAPDCSSCSTRHCSVFSDLAASELSTLANTKSCRSYSRGEMIFYGGDVPAGVYCVHRGTVKIVRVGSDGREVIVRLAGPGEILGYRSLLEGTSYSSYAMPVEPAQICLIPRSEFFALLGAAGDCSMRVLGLLSNDLRVAEERIVEMAQKPVRERVAAALVMLARRYGFGPDGATLRIRLTRQEIANIVGTATESAIRVLSALRREGLIAFAGRRIQILDRGGLIELANVEDWLPTVASQRTGSEIGRSAETEGVAPQSTDEKPSYVPIGYP